MYLLKLYADIPHKTLVRADRYPTIKRVAYFLGREPATIYNFLRQKSRGKGILRFVELKKC